MTDPLRSDASAAQSEVDRDAHVDDLLLSGLNHYFAGQHELAINVWTRVLFLDRGHARARAYIERARGAIAERQREGEELIHTGAEAFRRGEADAARRLLTSAVEHGAGTEEALALLGRLDRLEAAGVQQESRPGLPELQRPGPASPTAPGSDRSWMAWTAAGAVLGVAAVAVVIATLWVRGDAWLPLGPATGAAVRASDEPLPIPSASEVWLARARAHYARGRLGDALDALEAIRPGDPLSVQADELRASIQSQLLAAARAQEPARAREPALAQKPTPQGSERQ
jgi:tetratricopeptide (TPR) repeat protein